MSIVAANILLLCATPVLIVLNAVFLPRLLTAIAERVWPERPAELSSVFDLASAFDSDQLLLWDPQIVMLRLVHQAGPDGIPTSRLHRAYRETVRRYPELYDGFTFDQWLRFLVNEQLAIRAWRRVRLTREGRDFLQFGAARREAALSLRNCERLNWVAVRRSTPYSQL